MARKHAQVLTSIWMDDDFTALTATQQRTYLFLLSQPDLSLAGVLVARTRVWARRCAGLTQQRLEDDLSTLDHAGLIVWDIDTDEVWLRSFHKHNVGLSPKTLIGASRAYQAVTSKTLRRCIADAVHPDLRDRFVDGLDRVKFDDLKAMLVDLTEWEPPAWEPPSDTPCDTPSEGASTTDTGYLTPDTGYRRPEEPSPPLAIVPDDGPSPSAPVTRYHPTFEAFWEACPRKTGKGAAARAFTKITRHDGAKAARIIEAMRSHAEAWATWPASDRQFIPHPATWLNEGRYDDPPPEPRAGRPGGSKADESMQRIAASLERAGGAS